MSLYMIAEAKELLGDDGGIFRKNENRLARFSELTDFVFENEINGEVKKRVDESLILAEDYRSLFITDGHRRRFMNAFGRNRRCTDRVLAQMYILSAYEDLWACSEKYVGINRTAFENAKFSPLGTDGYVALTFARDIGDMGERITYDELSDRGCISVEGAFLIINALVIMVFGINAVYESEEV